MSSSYQIIANLRREKKFEYSSKDIYRHEYYVFFFCRYEQSAVEEICARHGARIVRMPPYHCDLNPIELVWGYLKRMLHCPTLKIAEIIKRTECILSTMTAEEAMKYCDSTRKVR